MKKRSVFILLLVYFAVYAGVYIYNLSFIVEGERHFVIADDILISMRYAKNLAEGHGLVFNIGEKVEGYSNFLWVIILAALHSLSGVSIPSLAQQLGILLGLANVLLTFSIASKLPGDENRRWAFAAALLVALDLRVAVWSVEGLETPLYLFWALAALRLYIDREQPGWWWSLPALGAALTRPDGAVLFIALGIHRLWRLVREKRFPAGADWIALAVFVVPYGIYNAWRIAYFGGYLLPNTFFARGSHGPLIGAIYVARGFGVAAGTHVFYNLVVRALILGG